MAITAAVNPANLAWANFTVVANQIPDPNDGTLVDAVTRFRFDFPDRPPRQIGTEFALAENIVITITPAAQVWSGVQQTAALLSHEQLHYDVGFVIARALARELTLMRGRSLADLRSKLMAAFNLHFSTRARLIQNRYDLDTHHGTGAHYQRVWKDAMTKCLADARASHLLGWWL